MFQYLGTLISVLFLCCHTLVITSIHLLPFKSNIYEGRHSQGEKNIFLNIINNLTKKRRIISWQVVVEIGSSCT